MGCVLCTRPTIWILDQYIRKQDGDHLSGIQFVWYSNGWAVQYSNGIPKPDAEQITKYIFALNLTEQLPSAGSSTKQPLWTRGTHYVSYISQVHPTR